VNGNLQLTGTLPVPPRVSLSAQVKVDVVGSALTIRPAALSSVLAKLAGTGVAASTVESFLTVRIPISQLPFGIQLQSAKVTPAGLVIAASASGLTIRAPSS
jgi:hypothetical protein